MLQMPIKLRLEEVLAEREKTLYWLAENAPISYVSLWRLKEGTAKSITFDLLEKICRVLECQPGDLIVYDEGKRRGK